MSTSITTNIQSIQQSITQCAYNYNRSPDSIRLIAVSKKKSPELIQQAYIAGQRYFGENYVQELIHKHQKLLSNKDDNISELLWHFIGTLQSNKAHDLVSSIGLQQLACVETVSSSKLAHKLNKASEQWNQEHESKLKLGIYIQVNTSGEKTKSGLNTIQEVTDLVTYITNNCPHLQIQGLMTIGISRYLECFKSLGMFRKVVAKMMKRNKDELELSMGMSGDFEEAIRCGATNLRIGSKVFGIRK